MRILSSVHGMGVLPCSAASYILFPIEHGWRPRRTLVAYRTPLQHHRPCLSGRVELCAAVDASGQKLSLLIINGLIDSVVRRLTACITVVRSTLIACCCYHLYMPLTSIYPEIFPWVRAFLQGVAISLLMRVIMLSLFHNDIEFWQFISLLNFVTRLKICREAF